MNPIKNPIGITPSNSTLKYWEKTKENELALPYCNKCDEFFFYPRNRCPKCMSKDTEFRTVSGEGTLISYTTIYHPPKDEFKKITPYINTLVRLKEGIRMMGNMKVENEKELKINMPVEVTFIEMEEKDYKIPYFKPLRE